jgi:hypothetical protein
MRVFMQVSQAMREILLTFVCMALMLLSATAAWLMSEADRRAIEARIAKAKEINND